jgi:hypothetical protein
MIEREKMLRWLEGQGAIEEIDRDYWSNHLDTEKAREFRNRASANIAIIETIRNLILTAPEPDEVKRLVEAVREMAKNGVAEYNIYSSIAGDPSPIYKVHKSDIEKVGAALVPFTKGEK